MIKSKLVIISDLFGFKDSIWKERYIKLLERDFILKFYDSCELAGIDKKGMNEEQLHSKFLNGGIEKAIAKLLELEKERTAVLAFSIGGTIAWKSVLKGLKVHRLYLVSSTRLRYEKEKPNCNCHLVFGQNDPYKPDLIWFQKLNLNFNYIQDEGHDLYKHEAIISSLCKQIITENIT